MKNQLFLLPFCVLADQKRLKHYVFHCEITLGAQLFTSSDPHPPSNVHETSIRIHYGHIRSHTYIHTYVHTYTRAYVHTYIRSYVYTYILNTYIHKFIRIYVQLWLFHLCWDENVPKPWVSIVFLDLSRSISWKTICFCCFFAFVDTKRVKHHWFSLCFCVCGCKNIEKPFVFVAFLRSWWAKTPQTLRFPMRNYFGRPKTL